MTDMVVPIEVLQREWVQKCKDLDTSVRKAQKRYDRFKPFSQREVKECYRNLDNNANIIIIQGYESGRYWLKKEFDADHPREKEKDEHGVSQTNATKTNTASRDVPEYDQTKTEETKET